MRETRLRRYWPFVVWFSSAICLCIATGAHANGFRNPPEGAAALGKTGGKIALTDDATAIAHNPANLVELDGPQFVESFTFPYGKTEFSAPDGRRGKTDDPWKLLPNFFYATPAGGTPYTFGISLTTPWGQSTEWAKDGPFAFVAPYYAELRTIDVTPTFAVRVRPTFQLGVGIDIVYSDLDFKQLFPWSMVTGNPGDVPGRARFDADGATVGARAGVTWKPGSGHRVAMTARSPVTIDYSGDFKVSNVPAALPGPLPLLVTPRSDFESEIRFPAVVALAYGLQVDEQFRVGVDIEWVEFSSYDELPVDIQNNSVLLTAPVIPQDWEDTWTAGVGLEYDLSDLWTVRGGYVWLESPVPERTLAPTLPDADRHILTAGLGVRAGRHGLDVAYGYSIYDDLKVTDNINPAFNGDYDIENHLLAVTYHYQF